jgi:photosystem II stability/assembly factor-like uncharacterized protein
MRKVTIMNRGFFAKRPWVPPAALAVALAALAGFAADPAGPPPLVWQPAGPRPNTRGQVENIDDREVEGAIRAVAPHPTEVKVLYVGAVNGGIWKTTNALDPRPVWQPQTDGQASLSIGALAFDPTDPENKTLVAGVGRFSSLGFEGGALSGILRTTDAGAHWVPLGKRDLAGLNIAAVAPRGAVIVVAVNGASLSSKVGIWRSTNTGAAWSEVSGAAGSGLPAGRSFDLAASRTNRDVLFTNAGTAGIFRSKDAGQKWEKVSTAIVDARVAGATNLKIATGKGDAVYVAVVNGSQLADVFRSPDGGATWAAMGVPSLPEGGIHPGGQGTLHLSLAADPMDPAVVYVGGDRQAGNFLPDRSVANSIGARDYSGILFRGTFAPAGSQWVHLTHSATAPPSGGGTKNGSAPHADSRDMKFAADGSLIESDDGGVYRRTNPRDNTGDWFSLNGNLHTTELHAVAWDSVAHVAIGGAQDTGTPEQEKTGGDRWQSVTEADGAVVAVDDTSNPKLSTRFSSIQFLGLLTRRVYDAANVLQSEDTPPLQVVNGDKDLRAQFYTPLVVNRVNGHRLIIGAANSVYESSDHGDTLTEVGPGIVVNDFGNGAIAYGAPGNEDVLYVGSADRVFVRMGPHPADLEQSLAYSGDATSIGGGMVVGIALDPGNPKTAYVADPFQVYRTTDAGQSWERITGNLPKLAPGSLRTIALHTGTSPASLVVGTDVGVFWARGLDFKKWAVLGQGLPRAQVHQVVYKARDRVLLAATLGRGAWTLRLPAPSGNGADEKRSR